MFGLFGAKNKKSDTSNDDKERTIIDGCSSVLGFSYEMLEEHDDKRKDNFSLGYVWGFVDCLLQNNGYPPGGKGFAIITIVFVKVFGVKEGKDLISRAFLLQESQDDSMIRGMTCGGNEAVAWMTKGISPVGWIMYVFDEDAGKVNTETRP